MLTKPNVLLIISDQLTWRALPCYGNTYVKTPHIDRIAEDATLFENAYTPCPLCAPARAAFWTGRYPHETGVVSNGRRYPQPGIPRSMPTLGSVFSDAGYECVHFGKRHDCGSLRGFVCEPEKTERVEGLPCWPEMSDTNADRYTTKRTVEYLTKRPAGDKPFFAVADLVNPHGICGWTGYFRDKHVDVPLPDGVELPSLPGNFVFDDIENRPVGIRYLCCSHNRQAQTSQWNEENFRYYLAAYYHYLRMVDGEIGLILDALCNRCDRDNTVIVFMADHGDSMAARRQVTKQVHFYEETVHVPLIFKGPGIRKNIRIEEAVTLLDLFPTMCGIAGIRPPRVQRGISLLPRITGRGRPGHREFVASQWTTEWGFTVSPGRMIRSEAYKYTHYTEDGCEELFCLLRDPLEKRNAAGDPSLREQLMRHRELLSEHIRSTDDDFYRVNPRAGKRWRSHKTGYEHHRGPAAPEFISAVEDENLG